MSQRICVVAPAKINLHLGVGTCLSDGYHQVCSVLHTLSLHDSIVLQDASALSVDCAPDVGVQSEQNLAYQAARVFADVAGRDPSFSIGITKRIPHAAGLGGGSSDAAAVITGLAHIWGIDRLDQRCLDSAAGIGADVPFFLYGGAALMKGKGDAVDTLLPPLDAAIAIVWPGAPAPTARVYSAFDEDPAPSASSNNVVGALYDGDAVRLGRALTNNLAEASVRVAPVVGEALAWLRKQPGALGADVAGSGSAVFAVAENAEVADRIAKEALAEEGWWACATSTSARGVFVDGREGQ